jgi:hypothetical protein
VKAWLTLATGTLCLAAATWLYEYRETASFTNGPVRYQRDVVPEWSRPLVVALAVVGATLVIVAAARLARGPTRLP